MNEHLISIKLLFNVHVLRDNLTSVKISKLSFFQESICNDEGCKGKHNLTDFPRIIVLIQSAGLFFHAIDATLKAAKEKHRKAFSRTGGGGGKYMYACLKKLHGG